MDLRFTWSPAKAKRNAAKHHVSFEAAKQVFSDPHMIVVEDCKDEHGELRYHAIGYGANPHILLTVVFADRSSNEQEVLHIISARRADDYEQSAYSDQF